MFKSQGFLSYNERLALVATLHRHGHTARAHVRANAILLLDKGWTVPQVAEALFLDEESIRNFFFRYSTGKLEALLNDNYQGKESKLSDEQKDQLRRHVADTL